MSRPGRGAPKTGPELTRTTASSAQFLDGLFMEEKPRYGLFHRLESPTPTPSRAAKMEHTGEHSGTASYRGNGLARAAIDTNSASRWVWQLR